MSIQSLSLSAALSAARRAVIVVRSLRDVQTLPPDDGGHDVSGQLSAVAGFHLRRGIVRSARIAIDTLDLTAVYTVTFPNGTTTPTATYDAGGAGAADAADVLDGIAAAIEALSGADDVATASHNTDATRVDVAWKARVATGITVAATGTGVLTCEADPESATAILYSRMPENVARSAVEADNPAIRQAASAWEVVYLGASPLALSLTDGMGWRDALDVGGFAGFAWLAEDVAGHANDGGSVTLTAPAAYIARSVNEDGA